MPSFRDYIQLTKPGIIRGNIVTAAAGFFLASTGKIDWWLLLAAIAGTSLIVACGCVINNYLDRNIDKHMVRTKNRALVQGTISARAALLFAGIVGVLGFATLLLFVNSLTALIGLVGLLFYAGIYTYYKPRTVHGTLIGSISGATPPIAGYTAVTGSLDATALVLFLILVCWQMPHFYGIAMYRAKEYAQAHIPVLPIAKSMRAAKIEILVYTVGFIITSSLLFFMDKTGYSYLIVMTAIGFAWLAVGLKGFTADDDAAWGRKMFFFSLIIIVISSVMIGLGNRLP